MSRSVKLGRAQPREASLPSPEYSFSSTAAFQPVLILAVKIFDKLTRISPYFSPLLGSHSPIISSTTTKPVI